MEAVDGARGDDSATASRVAHASDELGVFDILCALLLEVIPEGVLHPLTEDLEGRLRAEHLLLRHVEVVDEDDESLATRRREGILSPLLCEARGQVPDRARGSHR